MGIDYYTCKVCSDNLPDCGRYVWCAALKISENMNYKNVDLQYFCPSKQLDIKLAYTLAKFGHRSQVRKELTDGKPISIFRACKKGCHHLNG